MTRTLLLAGTASHVGKSTMAAGFCRLLSDRGLAVAPYKAQNMSNNARVVTTPDGEWGEIGVSQFVQARAAGVTPTTDMNPVLLKPRGAGESQLIIQGQAREHIEARRYYDDHWDVARTAAHDSYERLAADADIVIAEGAGSIAEINLHHRDLANVETARFGNAEIILLVDIERGGAFASLYGTIELLPEDLREQVVGALITKFRGDPTLLESGIEQIEEQTGVPILGVIPYDDPGLPEEDSLALPATDERTVVGDDDGVPDAQAVQIAVPRLPRISNATDLEALSAVPGVRVVYVPLEGTTANALENADGVVIPGTKNTVDDLLALMDSPLAVALKTFEGPTVGLCGGYQLLGERISNAALEGTTDVNVVAGLGLLPVETQFAAEKHIEQATVEISVSEESPFAGATGTASGYEIHAGRTTALKSVSRPFGPSSAGKGPVVGTYLHGLFDNDAVRNAFLETLATRARVEWPPRAATPTETAYDRAATLVEQHVNLEALNLAASNTVD